MRFGHDSNDRVIFYDPVIGQHSKSEEVSRAEILGISMPLTHVLALSSYNLGGCNLVAYWTSLQVPMGPVSKRHIYQTVNLQIRVRISKNRIHSTVG